VIKVPEHLMPLTEPRHAPPALLPAAAGGIVLAIALPIFPARRVARHGWALGAVLWVGSEALAGC